MTYEVDLQDQDSGLFYMGASQGGVSQATPTLAFTSPRTSAFWRIRTASGPTSDSISRRKTSSRTSVRGYRRSTQTSSSVHARISGVRPVIDL